MAEPSATGDQSREAFDRKVRESDLLGYWMIPSRSDGFREPPTSYAPYLWHWDEINEIYGTDLKPAL